MTNLADLTPMMRRVAKAELGADVVQNVALARWSDSEGQDSFKLTIFLNEGAVDKIEDDSLIDVLVALRRAFGKEGIDQAPSIEYVVPSDLADDGDT